MERKLERIEVRKVVNEDISSEISRSGELKQSRERTQTERIIKKETLTDL